MISESQYKSMGIKRKIEELDKSRRQLNKFFLYIDAINSIEDSEKIKKKLTLVIKRISNLQKTMVQYKKGLEQ